MPINKKDNKKNAPKELRDSAIVPTKKETGKKQSPKGNQKTIGRQRVNALGTAGKKKRPK